MPRAGLTPERIISEAATVADEVGLDRLTLAAVAHRCGVSLPGLYKHVSGLDEVRRGIALLGVKDDSSADIVTAAKAGNNDGAVGVACTADLNRGQLGGQAARNFIVRAAAKLLSSRQGDY